MEAMLGGGGGVVAPTVQPMTLEDAADWLADIVVSRVTQTGAGVIVEGLHDVLGWIVAIQAWNEMTIITA